MFQTFTQRLGFARVNERPGIDFTSDPVPNTALNINMMSANPLAWTTPDPREFEDTRAAPTPPASSNSGESEDSESEDSKPLYATTLPSASNVSLPKWSSDLTRVERETRAAREGELTAKEVMAVQLWERKMTELGDDSEYNVKIAKYGFAKRRQAILDQFCKGGFKMSYLNALIAYQDWAEQHYPGDPREAYTDTVLWDYLCYLNKMKAAPTRAETI